MPTGRKFRLPVNAIILDLVGTLLLIVGGFDLMNAPLLGPVSQLAAGQGALLMTGGGILMFIGTGLFVSRLLTIQRSRHTPAATPAIRTVDRRSR